MTEKQVTSEIIMNENPHPFKDSKLPLDTRKEDLINRMNFEKEDTQMFYIWDQNSNSPVIKQENFLPENFCFRLIKGISQVASLSDSGTNLNPQNTTETTNIAQRYFVENTSPEIPVILYEECLLGMDEKVISSNFQPIELTSTFKHLSNESFYTSILGDTLSNAVHQSLTLAAEAVLDTSYINTEEILGNDSSIYTDRRVRAVRVFNNDIYSSEKEIKVRRTAL